MTLSVVLAVVPMRGDLGRGGFPRTLGGGQGLGFTAAQEEQGWKHEEEGEG